MSYNFCFHCGAQLPSANESFAPQHCANCGRTHYHNSKPCAGALIVRDGRVLLVKRAVEPFKDHWDLPGGFLEAGEHPLDGMFREVREETGLDVRVLGFLGEYIDRYHYQDEEFYTLSSYYVVEPMSGTLRAADDVDAFQWFALDALPDAIAFEHPHAVLRDLRRWMTEDERRRTEA